MKHYQADILFNDNNQRSINIFIYFDEFDAATEDEIEERLISLAYKELMELGFNKDPNDINFMYFDKIVSITHQYTHK